MRHQPINYVCGSISRYRNRNVGNASADFVWWRAAVLCQRSANAGPNDGVDAVRIAPFPHVVSATAASATTITTAIPIESKYGSLRSHGNAYELIHKLKHVFFLPKSVAGHNVGWQHQTQQGAFPQQFRTPQPHFQHAMDNFAYSAKHAGLYLYIGRLLRPLWKKKCVIVPQCQSSITSRDCTEFLEELYALKTFLEGLPDKNLSGMIFLSPKRPSREQFLPQVFPLFYIRLPA